MEAFTQDELTRVLPSLMAFAMSLSGNIDRAKDLVQETVTRAYANQDIFRPGTNLAAWLFTILRNEFRSQYRKRKHEVEDAEGLYAATLMASPEQLDRMELNDVRQAIENLPPDHRQAILLVGAGGFSYAEAADICNCAVGTIKSRVNRARAALQHLLEDRHYLGYLRKSERKKRLARGSLIRIHKKNPTSELPSVRYPALTHQPASLVVREVAAGIKPGSAVAPFSLSSMRLSQVHQFPDGSVAEVFAAI